MPQLPSGLRFALDPAPLADLIRAADGTALVHPVMAVESFADLCEHIIVMFFRPMTENGTTRQFDSNSVAPPTSLEPYPSGFTLATFLGQMQSLTEEDQAAVVNFLDEPRTVSFLERELATMKEAQQALLNHPKQVTRMFATMWRAKCHPLQEDGTYP